MIDNFALALPHALMAIAIWRLLSRADLDSDVPQDGESVTADSAGKRPVRD